MGGMLTIYWQRTVHVLLTLQPLPPSMQLLFNARFTAHCHYRDRGLLSGQMRASSRVAVLIDRPWPPVTCNSYELCHWLCGGCDVM